MKLISIFPLLVSLCMARPQQSYREATILRYDNENYGTGNYKFSFETSDGTSREEIGELENAGSENEALVVRGSYSYIGDDGVIYTVNYIADEYGYRADGPHISGSSRTSENYIRGSNTFGRTLPPENRQESDIFRTQAPEIRRGSDVFGRTVVPDGRRTPGIFGRTLAPEVRRESDVFSRTTIPESRTLKSTESEESQL